MTDKETITLQQLNDFVYNLDNETIGKAVKLLILYGYDIELNDTATLFNAIRDLVITCKQDNTTLDTLIENEIQAEKELLN